MDELVSPITKPSAGKNSKRSSSFPQNKICSRPMNLKILLEQTSYEEAGNLLLRYGVGTSSDCVWKVEVTARKAGKLIINGKAHIVTIEGLYLVPTFLVFLIQVANLFYLMAQRSRLKIEFYILS